MTPDRARELLDAEARRLQSLLEKERQDQAEWREDSTGELSSFDQHPADIATETHEREVDATLAQSMELGLTEVQAARSRVDDGTYGRCEECGEPIPDERLEAQPTARFCVRHQAEQEHQAQHSERSGS